MKFKIKLSSVALIPITFAVVSHCAQPQSNYRGVLPTVADTYYTVADTHSSRHLLHNKNLHKS